MKSCLLLLLAITLSGCAVKIVPQPTQYGTINKDFSQTVTKDGISITARMEEPDVIYDLAEMVTPVSITIDNKTDHAIQPSPESFILIDDNGSQHSPITPDSVREIVSKNRYYLLPYPYVGFYYLEDYEKISFYNQFNSQLPYYYEVYPQDLYTKAFPMTTVVPNAKINGLIFFNTDIRKNKTVELRVYPAGIPKTGDTNFKFPFAIQ